VKTARLLPLLLSMASGAARAEWIADAGTGVVYDSNVSLAQSRSDIKHDALVFAEASGGQFVQLTDRLSGTLTGRVRKELYSRYTGLSNLSAGLSAAARWKFGLGAGAPWARLGGSATRLDYRNNLRSGWLYETALSTGIRAFDRWELDAGYRREHRSADQDMSLDPDISAAVFSQHASSEWLGARFELTQSLYPFVRYTRRSGDITATTQPNLPIYQVSSAVAFDPVFGTGAIAYKLHATTHIFAAGLTQAVGAHASINLSIERRISHGDSDINYYGTAYEAQLLYEF